MLLGALDEATGVVHVDVATQPPPGSRCSAVHFDHSVEGTQETVDHYRSRIGDVTTFVRMWHTHPQGEAGPSPMDELGMANLVTPVLGGPPRSLMLIVGGRDPDWRARRDHPILGGTPSPDMYVRVVRRRDRHARARPRTPGPLPRRIRSPGGRPAHPTVEDQGACRRCQPKAGDKAGACSV
jgi:hypothetical protein